MNSEVLRENLTDEQYLAVIDDAKYILCLACAGSGKSRTLAYKIAYLIAKGEPADSIIAFTFTEKAAESIKRRVAEALKKLGLSETYVGAMYIGTIDAFCQKILGDMDAKYRQYDILDQNGLILFLMSRYRKVGLSFGGSGYFRGIIDLADAWQTLNNEALKISDVEKYNNELGEKLNKLKELLLKDGYMDFSFAIRMAVERINEIREVKGNDLEKYKYLFVDEYQDVNPIQEAFINELSKEIKTLFVVGDDDQAIYGWRGANVNNILTFDDRYKNVSTHRLLTNFRSTHAIVETASSFVESELNVARLEKKITADFDGNIQDLRKLWFSNREEEAKWVADRIQSLIGTEYIEYNPDKTEKCRRGLSYSDFAILLRGIKNKNGENRDKQFVDALKNLGIPVRTTGEGGIFDRPYAACVLATMELLRSGPVESRQIAKDFFEKQIRPTFPEADLDKFLSMLHTWSANIHAPITSGRRKVYPQAMLHDIIDAFMVRNMKDETAIRDLGLFSTIILDIEKTYISIDSDYRYREMLNFIGNIAQNNYELESLDYISKEDAVSVSSIHKVKGLEFPVVFVVDLVNLRFPGKTGSYDGLLPNEIMREAINRGAYGNRSDDEARLFYTAITRAERFLYLTGSERHPDLKNKKKMSRYFVNVNNSKMKNNIFDFDCNQPKIERAARFNDDELPTDFSSIKEYLTCPYAYKLDKMYGYNAAVPELFGFGQATHTIIEKLHQLFKNKAPQKDDIDKIVNETFMLKHVFQSTDPENRPGAYERAKELVKKIVKKYVNDYSSDFTRIRQDEARFELSVENALITGAIDLLLKEDENKKIAEVIDFKSMEIKDAENYDWREMSIQVQLYSRAAKEIIGQNAEIGHVHLLKSNDRVPIPVDDNSVNNAIGVVEWAVKGILNNDFPMRGNKMKCDNCDFQFACAKECHSFIRSEQPPVINTPYGEKNVAAYDMGDSYE